MDLKISEWPSGHGRDGEFMSSEIMGESIAGIWRERERLEFEGGLGWMRSRWKGKGTCAGFGQQEIDHEEETRVRIRSSSRPDPPSVSLSVSVSVSVSPYVVHSQGRPTC